MARDINKDLFSAVDEIANVEWQVDEPNDRDQLPDQWQSYIEELEAFANHHVTKCSELVSAVKVKKPTTKQKIFLDDERFPVGDGWTIVRSFDEAVSHIEEHGFDSTSFISFDHDLGEGKSGHEFAIWLVDYCLDNSTPAIHYDTHSQNPVGARNIKGVIDWYNKWREE